MQAFSARAGAGAHRLPTTRLGVRRCVAPQLRVQAAAVKGAGQQQAIIVKSNIPKDKLQELGVSSWPTWSCDVSTFPWSYGENETCYVLEGRVIVTPDGGQGVEIQAGDMATFPAGMSCTWDVKEAIRKHYNFH